MARVRNAEVAELEQAAAAAAATSAPQQMEE